MSTHRSSSQPIRPAQLDPRDFPSLAAYQAARNRERNRVSVRNIRLSNPDFTLADIVNHTGLPSREIQAALEPDLIVAPMAPS